MSHFSFRLTALFFLLCATAPAQSSRPTRGAPDLTRSLDFERKGEYHLGPTGAKGWIYSGKNFMTTEARQILITGILPGSPAEGKLQIGDIILGVGEELFQSDARRALGEAISLAEGDENGGKLTLLSWKSGQNPNGAPSSVTLKLPVLGNYSQTSPWNCPKTEHLLDLALKDILAQNDFGRFGVNALALLATGEDRYIKRVRDYLHQQKWAKPDIKLSVEKGGMVAWSCGYQNLLLTEYYLLTGDDYVLPAIREYAVKTAMGQNHGGTWGHGFAWTSINDGKLHGKLPGYGALNQSGLPCYLSLLLAKKCGIEDPEVDAAIARSSQFFSEFIDLGSICYGYHRPSLEIHASGRNGLSGNGKNAIAAVAFQVEGNKEGRRFFSRLTSSLYNTCEYGHSGNSYSYFWDALGANVGGPHLASAFLKELRWYHTLTRLPDGSFANQPLGGHYGGKFLSPTAAQILIATLPRRAIHLTGKGQSQDNWLTPNEAKAIIHSGRWRTTDTTSMKPEALLKELGGWSPISREWAAKSLATKEGDFTTPLLALLKTGNPAERAGACAALGHLGERSTLAIPEIAKALDDQETAVAIAAAYALARLGETARDTLPDLLRALVLTTTEGSLNPRQQALGYAFGHVRARTAPLYFNGLLASTAKNGNPLDGLDRSLLYPAVTKLLNNSSGRVRGCGAHTFRYFNRGDVAYMAQEIYRAIQTPTMSHMMFADAPRAEALDLMARLNLKEGIPLALETFDFGSWGAYARFPARFKTLQEYGGQAKPWLPQIKKLREKLKSGEHRENLEKTIKMIEKSAPTNPLISLHDLVDERLNENLSDPDFTSAMKIDLCREWLQNPATDSFLRAACLRKLVGQSGTQVIPELESALKTGDPILRETAEILKKQLSK